MDAIETDVGDESQRSAVSALFELDAVTVRGTPRDRLHRISLRIGPGVTAVAGNSGAGKTSLLNLLADFEQPDAGRCARHLPRAFRPGDAPNSRLPRYWAPQGGGLWPHLTVSQHLTTVSSRVAGAPNPRYSEIRAISSDETLAVFDLADRRDAFPGELSQGERSRLAIARALVSGANILLLDEPLAHVDPARRAGYWHRMRQVFLEYGVSVVFASHEPDTIVRESSRVIGLCEGRLIFDGMTRDLYENPPDRACGELLGRLNWFLPDEAAEWIAADSRTGRVFSGGGLRPEHVELQRRETAGCEVVWTVSSGSYVESLIRHLGSGHERVVIHRASGERLRDRDRVQMSVRGAVEPGQNT